MDISILYGVNDVTNNGNVGSLIVQVTGDYLARKTDKREVSMNEIISIILGLVLLVGCASNQKSDNQKLSVSATSVLHAEILEQIKPTLKERHNLELDIKITDDYYIPNKAVNNGDVDANFFQHTPFLDEQIKEHKYQIEKAGLIKLNSKVDKVSVTLKDITENTKKLKFKADVDPALASKVLKNNETEY